MVEVWDEVRDDLAKYRRISLMTVRDETGTDKIVKLDVTEVNYVFPVFNLVQKNSRKSRVYKAEYQLPGRIQFKFRLITTKA